MPTCGPLVIELKEIQRTSFLNEREPPMFVDSDLQNVRRRDLVNCQTREKSSGCNGANPDLSP